MSQTNFTDSDDTKKFIFDLLIIVFNMRCTILLGARQEDHSPLGSYSLEALFPSEGFQYPK